MSQNMMKDYLYSTVFVWWYGTVFHHFQHLFFATQVIIMPVWFFIYPEVNLWISLL